jgi:pimeloyl-ACP methyl ester carboxylesterase
VMLVHGAFADASGWSDEIRRLRSEGYPVLAPSNPLRGIALDAAYLRSVLATIDWPIILVGHSYGGAVITNAASGNPNVKALVYVAAFAPDEGETLAEAYASSQDSLLTLEALDVRPYPLPGGGTGADAYIKLDRFHKIFGADLPRSVTDVMALTQRPLEAAAPMRRAEAIGVRRAGRSRSRPGSSCRRRISACSHRALVPPRGQVHHHVVEPRRTAHGY